MNGLYAKKEILADIAENMITVKTGNHLLHNFQWRELQESRSPIPLRNVGGPFSCKPCSFTLTCVSQALVGKNAANIGIQ